MNHNEWMEWLVHLRNIANRHLFVQLSKKPVQPTGMHFPVTIKNITEYILQKNCCNLCEEMCPGTTVEIFKTTRSS